MIDYCRERGTQRLTGEALADNERLFALVRRQGFTLAPSGDGTSVTLGLDLAQGGGRH
jgi:hypothetical protein